VIATKTGSGSLLEGPMRKKGEYDHQYGLYIILYCTILYCTILYFVQKRDLAEESVEKKKGSKFFTQILLP